MWGLLSDPGHAASFDHLGEAYAPLRRLVEQLASREYAGRVCAFKWMASFNLTTAPTDPEIAEHDQIGIEYVPDQGVFRVGYNEATRPGRIPQVQTTLSRVRPQEVVEVIDRRIRRLLLSPLPPKPESADARGVLALVLFASIFVFIVCLGLMWARVEITPLALLSMGLMAIATSLLQIGAALNPSWAEGRWGLRPGEMIGPPNCLTSLGVGLWFGSGGLIFLVVAIFGRDAITQYTVFACVGAFALGIALGLTGNQYARRQAVAFGAIRAALMEYADRHDGWFPKGEASQEASLSLLHRENSGLVTAGVLCGRTVSEFTVKLRLDAGQTLTPETCGWHYVEGLRKHDDPRLALFWDKTAGLNSIDAWLSSGGHFVYFLGGSVEYIPDDRWAEFLAEQEWLRAGIMR